MTALLRVRRSRGAASGLLLMLLGAWGGLVPFVGPYFHYAYTPDSAWQLNNGRIWLEILPAVAVLLGGLVLAMSKLRPAGMFGAWLAAIGGAWFAVGTVLAALWTTKLPAQGTPVGGTVARVTEQVGFFTGLGIVIVFVAAVSLGRLSIVAARDAELAAAERAGARAQADRDDTAPAEPVATRSPSSTPGQRLRAALGTRKVVSGNSDNAKEPAGSGSKSS
jgi:hypothetical protein